MKIRISIPYSLDKNLGKEYNEEMKLLQDDDWACLIDHDVQFLTSDAIRHLYKYVELFPDTGIFTCFTNRLHPLAKNQLYNREVDQDDSMINHSIRARSIQQDLYKVTELQKHISGFLMLISVQTWADVYGFNEDKLCLGVDNIFSDKVLAQGKKIRRMDGIYCWHSYRLLNGIKDKTHLL